VTSTEDFEIERIRSGNATIGGHWGFLVAFVVRCTEPSQVVLDKVLAVMSSLLENSRGDWPVNQAWRKLLPSECMSWFEPELSGEEREKHRQYFQSLSHDERMKIADRWQLSDWLYCMQPSEREWRWSIARCIDDNTIVCVCEFANWPAGWGQLAALFLACGAKSVGEGVEYNSDIFTLIGELSEPSDEQKQL
jgi:hypothetical protein